MIVITQTTIIIILRVKPFFLSKKSWKRGVTVPQNSRYTNAEFETLMNKVILTLEENDAGRDLSLMVLGNVITHILQTQVSPDKREAMADQFANVLKKSVQG